MSSEKCSTAQGSNLVSWEPFSGLPFPVRRCQHTRDHSQLQYFSFSWDITARAGGSGCCCPLQHSHPRESQFVRVMGKPFHSREGVKTLLILVFHPFLLQTPCQSLFVLDFPLHIWDNSISSACHVYFQWFSGAVFCCFVYWFAQCTAALLECCRHHGTINRRSNS